MATALEKYNAYLALQLAQKDPAAAAAKGIDTSRAASTLTDASPQTANAANVYMAPYYNQSATTPTSAPASKSTSKPASTKPASTSTPASSLPAPGSGLTLNGVPFNPLVDDPNDIKYINPNPGKPGETLTINGIPFSQWEASQGGSVSGTDSGDTKSLWESSGSIADVPNSTDLMQQQIQAQKESMMRQLDAALSQKLNELKKTYATNLSTLDAAAAGLEPTYQEQRNRAAAQSDIARYNFAQNAAALGIQGSAAQLDPLYRNIALQNTLGQLGAAQAQDLAALDRQRALLTANYNTDLASAQSDAAIQAALAGANYDTDALALQIRAMQEEAARQSEQSNQARQDWLNTMSRFSNDYQAEINRVQNDGDPSNDWQIPYLQAARQDKIRAQQEAEAAAAQQEFENRLALTRAQNAGSSNQGPSYDDLYKQMMNLRSIYVDDKGQLSAAGEQALRNFAVSYGGQYAGQLLAAFGVGGYSKVDPDTYIAGLKRSVGARGFNVNQIRDNLATFLREGRLTEAEVAYILNQLGLS